VFHRAIEHGNLLVAEMTIREIGVVALDEALELTALMAQKGDWPRARRVAARWLERFLAERSPTIDEAMFVAGCWPRSVVGITARRSRRCARSCN